MTDEKILKSTGTFLREAGRHPNLRTREADAGTATRVPLLDFTTSFCTSQVRVNADFHHRFFDCHLVARPLQRVRSAPVLVCQLAYARPFQTTREEE